MDDDDKVRRNLMAASFAVLLYFWLELPDSLIVKRLLGEEQAQSVPPWKIWLCIVAVLSYQVHRFISASVLTGSWGGAATEFRNRRAAFFKTYIEHAEGGLKTAQLPRWMSYGEPACYGTKDFTSLVRDAPQETRDRMSFLSANAARGDDSFYFSIPVEIGTEGTWNNHKAVFLYVPPNERWRVDLRVLIGMTRSAYFSEFALPMLVGYAALVCSIAALTRNVLS